MTTTLLRITELGQGEPLVLLHGFLSSSHYFRRLVRHVQKTNKVVMIDLLGFGQSPKPEGPYTYDSHIQAIHDTLEYYKIKGPITLLGHSTGALIAQRYAQLYPNAIKTTLIFNPPLFLNQEQAREVYKTTGRHYKSLLYSPRSHYYWRVLKMLPRNLSRFRSPLNLADPLRASRAAREQTFRNVTTKAQLFADLMQAKRPALLVVGKRDRPIYEENLRHVTLLPLISLRAVDSDHHVIARKPAFAAQIIQSYLLQ